MTSVFPDAKCSVTYDQPIAFHPVQKQNICGSVSGKDINIIDQNNFDEWVVGLTKSLDKIT